MHDPLADIPVINVKIDLIDILADRQRAKATPDDTLRTSIQSVGLLNPIIIRHGANGRYILVAGERRLTTFKELERDTIPARLFENLSERQTFLIELQENLARNDLTWQEQTIAIFRYHQMQVAAFSGWTQLATGTDLGLSEKQISRYILIGKELEAKNEQVMACASLAAALNLVENRAKHAIAAASARGLMLGSSIADSLRNIATGKQATEVDIVGIINSNSPDQISAGIDPSDRQAALIAAAEEAHAKLRALEEENPIQMDDGTLPSVLNMDFLDWLENHDGSQKFDVIHCDFPYGKNYSGARTRRTGKENAGPLYDDNPDVYFTLVREFLFHQEKFILPQAHCMFWFDMQYYSWTIEMFTKAGWQLSSPYPLVWHKESQGVASDPRRRFRHCYEVALLFNRGDRHLPNVRIDHYGMQVSSTDKLHISQKPVKMLEHFIGGLVNEWSCFLDPTCGSGTSLVAANNLGVKNYLGIEMDSSNADIARYYLADRV